MSYSLSCLEQYPQGAAESQASLVFQPQPFFKIEYIILVMGFLDTLAFALNHTRSAPCNPLVNTQQLHHEVQSENKVIVVDAF
jgi:hypothetical protein